MTFKETYDVGILRWDNHHTVVVNAGQKHTERVVPPAGEDYAFDRDRWPVRVEVAVSPTGRSVQVFVNGERVHHHIGGPR